jgi:ATP-binding cassette subfamily G (WHITE) protein 2
MGASGGGKTTLLSTLSLRLDTNFMDIAGEIRLNGREYSKSTLKSMSAYVMQDDLLHAELTVMETLQYAQKLRMDQKYSNEERQERVKQVLDLMGITHCSDVIIGNTRKKGISGGERKRVCIAIELLNHPKLMFLDEPTSGLDSSTALSVSEALKKLSEIGECTVVCTIHQPQPKIFNLFDNLILMKKGKVVYQGSAQKVDRFINEIGVPCPPDVNIADHLLDLISPVNAVGDRVDEHQRGLFVPVDLSLGLDKALFSSELATSWFKEFIVLCERNIKQYIRRPDMILMNLVGTVIIAIFIGCGAWHFIGTAQGSIRLRTPSLFFCCVSQGIAASLQSINSFPGERAIMLRERASGTYQTSSYFMARTIVDMITQLWPPIIFSLIVYFCVGYQHSASKFFLFTMFMILDTMAATSLATAVTCMCVSVEMSTIALSCLFEICRLYGGFFVAPSQFTGIPQWRFADALSYIKYAFVGVALNELHGLELSCPVGTVCQFTNGAQITEFYGYNDYTIGFCAGILVVLIVGFRLIGYLGLRFIKF